MLLHLLGEGILESEVVPPVDQELVLQMLGWVEIFASWLLTVTSPLNTVIAGCNSPVLNFNIWWRMSKLALSIRASALLPLVLPTHLQLQPPAVLLVQEGAHVEHGEGLGVDVGGVGHRRGLSHGSSSFDCGDSPHRNLSKCIITNVFLGFLTLVGR